MKYKVEVVGHGSVVSTEGVDLDAMDAAITAFKNNKTFEMRTPNGNMYVKTAGALAMRITKEED
jgi:hypothetical protein